MNPASMSLTAPRAGARRLAGGLAIMLAAAALSACTPAPAPTGGGIAPSATVSTPAASSATLSLTLANGAYTLAGTATDTAAKSAAAAAVGAGLGGAKVTDQLNVVPGAVLPPAGTLKTLASALAGVDALSLNVNAGEAVLAGTVSSDAEKAAAASAVAAAFLGANVTNNVSVVPVCTVVGAKVREASKPPALVFASGSADLSADSKTAVTKIAQLVQQCPGTKLTVVGQTDKTGSETGNEKLALTRAQAVATALVGAGVPAGSVLVQGNAANAPVSSDASLNRRVDVAVQ